MVSDDDSSGSHGDRDSKSNSNDSSGSDEGNTRPEDMIITSDGSTMAQIKRDKDIRKSILVLRAQDLRFDEPVRISRAGNVPGRVQLQRMLGIEIERVRERGGYYEVQMEAMFARLLDGRGFESPAGSPSADAVQACK